MKELIVLNHDGIEVIDSREVAEMVDKRHDHLLRDIDKYVEIMSKSTAPKLGGSESTKNLTAPKIEPSEFFVSSIYKDSTGRKRPCYLLTKKGCDMVANKMIGEKGVLFTAAYVTAFEKMRKQIQEDIIARIPKDYPSALRALADAEEQKVLLQAKIKEDEPKVRYYDIVLACKNVVPITVIAKDYGWSPYKMNRYLNERRVQYKRGDTWVLYQKYADRGYTGTQTHTYEDREGMPHARISTQWTQAGRLFIYDLLKADGIVPLVERDCEVSA